MLKELNSVLAVRNIEKQRKREMRERKKQGGLPSLTNHASVSHSQPPTATAGQEMTIQERSIPVSCDQELHISLPEEVATDLQIVEGDIESKLPLVPPIAGELSPEKQNKKGFDGEFKKFDLLPHLHSGGQLQWDNSALETASIAQAVAAIALRTGRANKEELFHDDQYSSAEDESS